MVKLPYVQHSNGTLRSATPGKIALFVGATSGVGLATLTEYARYANQPKVYIVGRNAAKSSEVIANLMIINPQGNYIPIHSEISLFKNVDAACEEFKSKEQSLDLLVMSPGYLKATRQADNADGIEPTLSLRYYVRMRFIYSLLSHLSAAPSARIMSIHGAGLEGSLNENDLLLQHTFTMRNAAMHTSTMNSLALEEIAANHPTISCVHVFPGLVITPAFTAFSEDWYFPLRMLFQWGALPLVKLFTLGLRECGERLLFAATSARYPPAGWKDLPEAGVALPSGVKLARGADGKEGSGCYLVHWNGETVGDARLLEDYRARDMPKKIWEHTLEVFDRAGKV